MYIRAAIQKSDYHSYSVIFILIFCYLLSGFCINGVYSKTSNPDTKDVKSLTKSFTFGPEDIGIEKEGEYEKIRLKGTRITQSMPGKPELPEKNVNILLPSGAEVVGLETSASEILVAEDIYPYPVQPPRQVSSTGQPKWVEPDLDVYSSSEIFPSDVGFLISGTQKMRGWHIAQIKLCPLRYLPARRRLYLATEIVVTVKYTLSEKKVVVPRHGSRIFEQAVKKIVVNPDFADAAPQLGSVGNLGMSDESLLQLDESGVSTLDVNPPGEGEVDYLIITPQSFVTTFQTLADYRYLSNGFDSLVLSTEYINSNYTGDDVQMRIRNCIIDYVNNYGTTFVVLGGDDTKVPDRDCYIKIYDDPAVTDLPCDMYYAGLDGTWDHWDNDGVYGEVDVGGNPTHDEYDVYADVYVGRIPVRTTSQASAYINKVLGYDYAQDEYLARKILVGGWEGWNRYEGSARPSGSVCDGHIGFRDDYHPIVSDSEKWGREDYRDLVCGNDWPVSQVKLLFDTINSWDNDGSSVPTSVYTVPSSAIISRLSEGWNIVHHFSHGSTSGLNFGGSFQYYYADDLSGPTNFWHTGACLTGGFDIREPCFSEALLRNPNGGAIVYMGNSRVNWGGIAQELNEQFLRLVTEQQLTNIAEIFYEHKLACNMGNPWERWTFYVMNLQGDPALEISPRENNVTAKSIDFVVCEGGSDTATIEIKRNSALGELEVGFQLSGTAERGEDFMLTPDSNVVVIQNGYTTATLTVTAVDDNDIENDKILVFDLVDGNDYFVSEPSSAKVLVLDNDLPGDFTCNGFVDVGDVEFFAGSWLTEGLDLRADIYSDDVVDFLDFAVFGGYWQEHKPVVINIISLEGGEVIPYGMNIAILLRTRSFMGDVVKVDIFANGEMLAEDIEGVNGWWAYIWTDYTTGHYYLSAVAYDDVGNVKALPAIEVDIVDSP